MQHFISKNKGPISGGLVAFIFIGLAVFVLGNLSGYEAKQLLNTSMSGINMLCNTIILASATILALLLTLLGISTSTKSRLKNQHYVQVLNIAKLVTVLFVVTLIVFQLFNIPITEAENLPTAWFSYIYWISLFFSSLLSGTLITVILLLYKTVTNIIKIVGLGKDHYLLSDEEQEDIENTNEDA